MADAHRLILPGDPEFDWTLATAPPPGTNLTAAEDGNSYAFIIRPDSGGIAEPCTMAELDDYLNSGEYDERLEEIDGMEADWGYSP